MSRLHLERSSVEISLSVITVLLGWNAFIDQARFYEWNITGGTGWLLALAIAGSCGAVLVAAVARTNLHLLTAFALCLTALSPAVFAYPLNVVLLLLAISEVVLAVRHGRHRRFDSASQRRA
jgi:hypothetical protein